MFPLLVVEDSPRIIPFYKELLPGIGFQPVIKTNLDDALAALANPENTFSGVITDGLGNGWQAIQVAALTLGLKTAVISTRREIGVFIERTKPEKTQFFYKPELVNLLPKIKEFFGEGSPPRPENLF